MIGRCCEPPCPPRICAYVRDCGGVPISGASVSVAGPSGFTASGTTDATGHWCADAGAAGSYSVTATDGAHTETKTVAVTTACTSHYATFCLGGSGIARIRILHPCGGGFPGLAVELRKGYDTASGTTDADGYVSICVPSSGLWGIHLTSPPCPFVDFAGLAGSIFVSTCATTPLKTITAQYPPLIYGCDCEGAAILVPTRDFDLVFGCGATATLDLGETLCVSVESDLICNIYNVPCDYGFPDAKLDVTHGTTGMLVAFGCALNEYYVDIFFGVQVLEIPCVGGGYDTAFPPLASYGGSLSCDYDWCLFQAGNVGYAGVRVPLTGTVAEGSLTLTGSIPSSVEITPDGHLPFPLTVPTPCPGVVTVTRTWCV